MVRLLCGNGASKTIANRRGELATDYAVAGGFPDLVATLEVAEQIGRQKVMIGNLGS